MKGVSTRGSDSLKTSPIRLALMGGSAPEVYHDVSSRLRRGCFAVVIDRDRAPGTSMAEATGATLVLESLEDALASHRDAFDAVVVRAPIEKRGAMACQAAAAGKHVLVDAPIAASAGDVEQAGRLLREKSVCAMAGGTLRFLAAYQEISSRLIAGKLGVPGLLRVHRWSSAESPPDTPASLMEQLAGDVDLAINTFASRPTHVYAIGRDGEATSGARPMPAYLQIHFGFPEGAMAVLDFATTLPAGQGYGSLHVIGSQGAAYADDHHNTHLLFRGGEPTARFSNPDPLSTVRELQEFVDAIVEDRPPAVGIEDGHLTHQVIEAIVQSVDSGQVLHLKDGVYTAAVPKE